jgi:hypothetical protein
MVIKMIYDYKKLCKLSRSGWKFHDTDARDPWVMLIPFIEANRSVKSTLIILLVLMSYIVLKIMWLLFDCRPSMQKMLYFAVCFMKFRLLLNEILRILSVKSWA